MRVVFVVRRKLGRANGLRGAAVAVALALAASAIPVANQPGAHTAFAAGGDTTRRVSIGSLGEQGNGRNRDFGLFVTPSISGDGRFVAFASDSSNLVANDTNGTWDVFVQDHETNTTTLVSVSSTGQQATTGAYSPSISRDGRYVAFWSYAPNLTPADTNSLADVFVRDVQEGTTERISTATTGAEGNGGSGDPAISADGRFVAFQSGASNLVADDTNGSIDFFVRDLAAEQTSRVSVASDGAEATGAVTSTSGIRPAISSDGRFVAFSTDLNGLVPADTDGVGDIFRHDRQSGQTLLISASIGGAPGGGLSHNPAISDDGSIVAFTSFASTLVPTDTNNMEDAFVRVVSPGSTIRASVTSGGAQSPASTSDVSLSGAGGLVAFSSAAGSLVPGDTNGVTDVFVRNLTGLTTTRVSVATGEIQANSHSFLPSMSADGFHVAFESLASNLVANDTNGFLDVFVRDAEPPPPPTLPILFVHGIRADSTDENLYKDLLDPLRDKYGEETIHLFEYFLDAACDNAWGVPPAVDPAAADFPTDPGGTECLSMSGLGLNALLLSEQVKHLHAITNKKVIIIGNSMGAAITRGMLAYSLQVGDHVATDMVDSVVFLQGAQQGSIFLANLSGTRVPQDIAQAAGSEFLRPIYGAVADTSARPALIGLTPQSAFYDWVNQDARVADIPTFNIFGDIKVQYTHCDLWVLNCHLDENITTNYGDLLLLPGSSNPAATPPDGGSKYLNGDLGPDNFQWGLHYTYAAQTPFTETFNTDLMVFAELWNDSPASHNAFERKIATTQIPDCETGASTPIVEELLKVINGRVTGHPLQCQAQWGDR